MKISKLFITLTIFNFGLLVYQVVRIPSVEASGSRILRCKGLEIVDDSSRVRASIGVLPPDGKVYDGKTYPETVILRLIDPNGRPGVKLTSSVEGSALLLSGEKHPTYVQLMSEGSESYMKLTNKDGKVQVVKP